MDMQQFTALANLGGVALLAGVITMLHMYNIKVVIPNAQAQFHAELDRERQLWREELTEVRENTNRRHEDIMRRVDALIASLKDVCRHERPH